MVNFRELPFRTQLFKPVIFLCVGFLIFYFLFLNFLLRVYLQNYLSRMNDGKVEIGKVGFSLWKGRFQMQDVEVANSSYPMKNLFEIENLEFFFQISPLLRKKIIIENALIQGIRYNTNREKPGSLDVGKYLIEGSPGILDRVTKGFFTGLKTEKTENPFQHISKFSIGVNLNSRIDVLKPKLPTFIQLQEYKKNLPSIIEEWNKIIFSLPTSFWIEEKLASLLDKKTRDIARKEIEKKIVILSEFAEKIKSQGQSLFDKVNNLESFLEKDLVVLQRELGIPTLDTPDLTQKIIAPKLLDHFERLAYWIDLSRRKMTKAKKREQFLVGSENVENGTKFRFGKPGTLPSFLLKKVDLQSEDKAETKQGKVIGLIQGITSQPQVYGHPALLDLKANFLALGIHGAHFFANIDHTSNQYKEVFEANIDSFRFKDFAISEVMDLKIILKEGDLHFNFRASLLENALDLQWKCFVSNAVFSVQSPYKETESKMIDLLNTIHSFTFSGKIDGPLDSLNVSMESDIGRAFATWFRNNFKNALDAASDSLRKSMVEQIYFAKGPILDQIKRNQESALVPIQRTLLQLNTILSRSK